MHGIGDFLSSIVSFALAIFIAGLAIGYLIGIFAANNEVLAWAIPIVFGIGLIGGLIGWVLHNYLG